VPVSVSVLLLRRSVLLQPSKSRQWVISRKGKRKNRIALSVSSTSKEGSSWAVCSQCRQARK
jgi:hypothetical protein